MITVKYGENFFNSLVVAIDIDPVKLELAQHNANVYGVAGAIDFILGDSVHLMSSGAFRSVEGLSIFMSPPWGGPTYPRDSVFDVDSMEPFSGRQLIDAARTLSEDIAVYLPRTVNSGQVRKLSDLIR